MIVLILSYEFIIQIIIKIVSSGMPELQRDVKSVDQQKTDLKKKNWDKVIVLLCTGINIGA